MVGKDADSHYSSIVGALNEIDEYVNILHQEHNCNIIRSEFGDDLRFTAIGQKITTSKHDRCQVNLISIFLKNKMSILAHTFVTH